MSIANKADKPAHENARFAFPSIRESRQEPTPSTKRVNPTYKIHNYKRAKPWIALVDRGANGGIAGKDMKVIDAGTVPKYLNLSGIDDHSVQNLKVVTAGAVVQSNIGQVILVMYSMAHMPDGKTILSSGQMEHFGINVNDKSAIVTGEQPSLKTPGGIKIPMSVVNGLAYLRLRPFTDKEFRELPHIEVTMDCDWDPKVLDSLVSEEWYRNNADVDGTIKDSMYDIYGKPIDRQPTDGHDAEPELGQEVEGQELEDDMEHPKRTGRREIQAHFHSLVKDEIQEDFLVYSVDGELRDRDYQDPNPLRRSKRNSTVKKGGYSDTKRKSRKSKTKPRSQGKTPEETNPSEEPNPLTLDSGPFDKRPEITQENEEVVTTYNNPARLPSSIEGEEEEEKPKYVWEGGPKRLRPNKKTLEKLAKYFPGIPIEVIKKTFECTTQYGRIGAIPGFTIRSRIRSPNPALNVPRRQESVATDTIYGPKGVPAVDDGSTAAQIFIGRTSDYQEVRPSGHSDGQFVKNLQDEIRFNGALASASSLPHSCWCCAPCFPTSSPTTPT